MTEQKGPFPAPSIQYRSPEWRHFSRLLEARRAQLRSDYENPEMTADKRLISLGKLILITELLALPELEKRAALAAVGPPPDEY